MLLNASVNASTTSHPTGLMTSNAYASTLSKNTTASLTNATEINAPSVKGSPVPGHAPVDLSSVSMRHWCRLTRRERKRANQSTTWLDCMRNSTM